jgi:1,4-dihydroxy-6-naphthoate synthase
MPVVCLSCSPDADDLFMMRAILDDAIDTGSYQFEISTQGTDSLNQLALGEGPDVVAISVAHYPAVSAAYQMLPHGGSMGEGYGPVVVANRPMALSDLASKRIAVPGLSTTAYTTLKMVLEFQPVVIPITPYQRIFDALDAGEVDAGLIIHEGRLTFGDHGLHSVIDLGQWWAESTGGLPLPLGANTIKRSLGPVAIREISQILRESIAFGLADREGSIAWLLARNGPLDTADRVSKYLSMYANQRTLAYGPTGQAAVQHYLDQAASKGLLAPAFVDFAP